MIKDIPFASDYQVDESGNVYSKERIITRKNGRLFFVKRRILRQAIDKCG